ncbi:TPA: TVP38/TMEM64 family protein, partial [Streptococcus pyogenes MGAS9959]|nr:TVP38/TMEM64 family protein [Streptococcus pyogenes MGAS9959]
MASPVSPADIMVMITGLTDMSLKRFVTILLITKPISIIGYSYLFIFGKDVISWFLQH